MEAAERAQDSKQAPGQTGFQQAAVGQTDGHSLTHTASQAQLSGHAADQQATNPQGL